MLFQVENKIKMNIKKKYKNFVLSHEAFSWEIDKDETRNSYINQYTFEINYMGFFYVFKKLKEIERFQPTISKKKWLEYRINSLGYLKGQN